MRKENMMKLKILSITLLSTILLSNSMSVIAETQPSIDSQIETVQTSIEKKVIQQAKSGESVDVSQIVEGSLTKQQEDLLGQKAEVISDGIEKSQNDVTYDDRYVNDMMEKASDTLAEIDNAVMEAKKEGEKLYTQEEILSLTPEEAGISEVKLAQIKSTIVEQLVTVATTEVAFENADVSDEIASGFNANTDIKLSLSMLQADPVDIKDGSISYAGYPGCVDNNGYGYKNVFGSDCWIPLMYYAQYCVRDEANKRVKSIPRYCVYNKNNCSWIVGHSKYGHSHSNWEKAWLS